MRKTHGRSQVGITHLLSLIVLALCFTPFAAFASSSPGEFNYDGHQEYHVVQNLTESVVSADLTVYGDIITGANADVAYQSIATGNLHVVEYPMCSACGTGALTPIDLQQNVFQSEISASMTTHGTTRVGIDDPLRFTVQATGNLANLINHNPSTD